ncbi:hypothetical protein [Pseudonocardia halophobica]|uniref:hypothetical protein n=1 Tax=Pseudonocardia halophobica TaxID=29401 RepID=UPI0018CBFD99|nr:hypothetical protein [Pseudonocardia halophobica]
MTTENLTDQTVRHTNSCYFTMVAMDADKNPVAVRPLTPDTPDEKRRWAEAELRRAERRSTP